MPSTAITTSSIHYKEPGKFEETRFEKIHNVIFNSSNDGSVAVAQEIASLIRQKQQAGKMCVLGLATGSSPIKVYEELVRLHQEEGLSFKNVVSFNLDEYFPMQRDDRHSYHYFMHEHLFNHVDIQPQNVHIPDGAISPSDVYAYCTQYEEQIKNAGGLDFQLLGIGRSGHIGFNEPGSHYNSSTRDIALDHITRVDAAPTFMGINNVPRKAITMGIATIKRAKRIVLLAWGSNKASVIKQTVEGGISSQVPATYLQSHPNVTFVLDEGAASALTRIKTPWVVTTCNWTEELKSRAIVWLCEQVDKPVLKLTDKDYNDYSMSDLLAKEGPAYDINIRMFNKLQHTITGWPGGKPHADDSHRPERAKPVSKRVIIFSPHPDDDVISMGGTFARLIEQGHEVHVAYQTSGNIAVSDEEALKYAEVALEISGTDAIKDMADALHARFTNPVVEPGIRKIKGLIRRKESLGATRFLGLDDERVHFLDMPFYETGTIKKNKLSDKDIGLIRDLIIKIKPHQIFAAGDLADPHGTHKVCLDAIFEALTQLKEESFIKDCWLWLYRGAWHEWDIHEIDMAVPMSPDQVLNKRHAIFYHQSQKDGAMFQGDDEREFWIRVEERTQLTAAKYNALGLAEYAAMEAFKRFYY